MIGVRVRVGLGLGLGFGFGFGLELGLGLGLRLGLGLGLGSCQQFLRNASSPKVRVKKRDWFWYSRIRNNRGNQCIASLHKKT